MSLRVSWKRSRNVLPLLAMVNYPYSCKQDIRKPGTTTGLSTCQSRSQGSPSGIVGILFQRKHSEERSPHRRIQENRHRALLLVSLQTPYSPQSSRTLDGKSIEGTHCITAGQFRAPARPPARTSHDAPFDWLPDEMPVRRRATKASAECSGRGLRGFLRLSSRQNIADTGSGRAWR